VALTGETLFPGRGNGPLLTLRAPLSLWGGVDPVTGVVISARHPQRGASLAGRVVTMGGLIGSSSSASIMLELIHGGSAPAAILLREADAILVVGCLAARELGYAGPPVARFTERPTWPEGTPVMVDAPARDRPAVIRAGRAAISFAGPPPV
jgi:predicted aconitase with swiveling domain